MPYILQRLFAASVSKKSSNIMHVTETIVISAYFIYLVANLTKKSNVFTPQLIFVKFANFCSMVFINPNRPLGRICGDFSTAWSLSVFIRHLLLVFIAVW